MVGLTRDRQTASGDETGFFAFEGDKNTMAYNSKDAGNFIWGNAMRHLGFNLGTGLVGAHADQIWNGEKGTGLFDNDFDQNAIKAGYNYFGK